MILENQRDRCSSLGGGYLYKVLEHDNPIFIECPFPLFSIKDPEETGSKEDSLLIFIKSQSSISYFNNYQKYVISGQEKMTKWFTINFLRVMKQYPL